MTAVQGAIRGGDTGARLGYALLGYMAVVTLMVTLLPFQFAWPAAVRVLVSGDPIDIAANVLLFVPLGFLYGFARPRALRHAALPVLAAGALASLSIEALQLLEPSRNSSLLDIVTNAAGAWIGALAFRRLARAAHLTGHIIGWLSLELPLMGVVYLLVPLLWINSLAAQDEIGRSVMTLLIAVFGALLLGGLQRHYFGPEGVAQPRQTAAFAGVWFMAGAFPALAWRPFGLISVAAVVTAIAWWTGRHSARATGANRRFEARLLSTAAPVYATYVLLNLLVSFRAGVDVWHWEPGFSYGESDQTEILRLLERVAAFTLVGYMLAEYRGRVESYFRYALRRLFAWGVSLACISEIVRGYEVGYGASVARGGILAAAVLYGGSLYYLQRAHVVRLLAGAERRAPVRFGR